MQFFKNSLLLIFVFTASFAMASINQTDQISQILPPDSLPFTIELEQIPLMLPNGIHSGASAIYEDKWFFIGGRTNGVHGFGIGNNNFPPQKQNTVVYVVDLKNEIVYSRSLDDPSSGLSQEQIDLLSVTSPQYFQRGKNLYMSGGYGVDTSTGLFTTKTALTAMNIPEFIDWVIKPTKKNSPFKNIRHTFDPILQVCGGFMDAVNSKLSTLLVFGQNFTGYYSDTSNGNYTEQVRRFKINDDGKNLSIKIKSSENPNPNYRRRDLNVAPVVKNNKKAYIALSGVFTLAAGVWTVPVTILPDGSTSMADPTSPSTFKQGMNNYTSAFVSMHDDTSKDSFIVLLGGISYGFFQNGVFETDNEIPFINQVTTVKIDKKGYFSQYLMANEYPVILSTGSNPGNTLLFGAAAEFIPSSHVPLFCNGVIRLNKIKHTTVLGYVVGGIMSTLANTNFITDSTASPYIFKVVLRPKNRG